MGRKSALSPRQMFWIILILIIIFAPRFFIPLVFLYFVFQIIRNIISLPQVRENFNISQKIKDFFEGKTRDTIQTQKSSKIPNYFTPMQDLQFKKIYILYVALILIVVFIIIDGLVSVPAGHTAVIYDRGRGVLEDEYPEGLHLKVPFWQVASVMNTRLQTYTMSIAPGEGAQYGDDSIEALTKDGQMVNIDISIQFRILDDDASWIYKNIGLDYVGKVVRPGVRNVIRDVITAYDSTKLFTQETREAAQDQMKEKLKSLYLTNKVELVDLLLRNIRFSDVYLQAIEDKQVAQQRIQKAEYEKQEAVKIKEKKIIEAEAEAEAIRLKGETLKANPQVIQFEFVQKMSPGIKWGILPDNVMPLLDLKSLQ